MTFLDQMRADVGDADPVWRYLLEKPAHGALITLALYAAGVPLMLASIVATLAYLIIGKILYHIAEHDAPWSHKDFVFDGLVGSLVIVIAYARQDHRGGIIALVVWMFLFYILDRARWGSPS